ncbi:MAG: hypothetical protein AVDCRST_MAG93-9444 [uncultured Chloroflexia bacterium]|uniref:Uncharacterized protein n=1 Tax=uncultured Chloroflexia bacterium TaxID=1672391 RepID=A0A6J4NEN7_9CHLR|nr:MAG: hypothetical protein AVDCRST_MAG93-9444 [uncultured Chloroflexia bacterium]
MPHKQKVLRHHASATAPEIPSRKRDLVFETLDQFGPSYAITARR